MQQLENIETEQFAEAVNTQEKNHLFPVFLKLENMRVLLVGAGKVGLEKLTAIIHNAPATNVTVVADKISAEVKHLAQVHENIHLTDRLFQADDLEGKEIVVIAVDDKETSAYIRALAKEKRLLVNVADTPDQCDFYLGSIVQKGSLKIAISTNGKSPTVAKRIKEVLQTALPADLDSVINNLNAIRNRLTGDFDAKVKKLNALTKGLVENEQAEKEKKWRRIATYSLLIFASMLIGHIIFYYIPMQRVTDGAIDLYHSLDKTFLIMIGAGFLAQLVDGALGMGYGVTSATILLSAGVNLSAISSSIHTAEMFASGASGYSHYKFGNVNKKLFKILVIPGVIGAVAGAYLLSKYGDKYANYVRPVMAVYTLLIGVRILLNAFRKKLQQKKFKNYRFLALAGGFLDSFGGGGWGPIVTTTLISRGRNPKYVIGSISLTEFFVTLASALTFFSLIGVSHWQVIVALIIGGLTAAPVAAKLAGKLPKKISFILLGVLVITWSVRILVKIF
jgi:siroheme synthase-like protein